MQKKNGSNNARRRIGKQRIALGKREKRRLLQLVLCIGIFLVVIVGKGSMPEYSLQYIQKNTDFKSAFSALIESISDAETVFEVINELKELVPERRNLIPTNGEDAAEISAQQTAAQNFVNITAEKPTIDSMLNMVGVTRTQEESVECSVISNTQEEAASAVYLSVYNGPTLPEGATMQYEEILVEEICVPVSGVISSVFGYRIHPINGKTIFHSGIDIAAEVGIPIKAFSAGKVEYIGESEAYGLYVQIDHGNELKTFYCHCDELLVSKGATITAGQTIATVGKSGNVTGPHLHFELKQNGVLLNPLYYIQ